MRLVPIGFFGFAVLTLLMGAAEGRAHGEALWQAYELPVDGRYYRGEINVREGSPLGRGVSVHGREMVFMARVIPGKAYTLGLRMPNKGRPRLAVSLYDRWPYEADAKSWHLQTGPALMSNRKYIEYQWRISTDPASSGNLMYMIVNVERPAKARRRRFPVYAFIVTPPVDPMRELGRGVTHLRGPSNLVFHGQSEEQVRVIRVIAPVERWDGPDEETWSSVNGLIPNGDFRDGLNRWHVFPEHHDTSEVGVAVGKHGLRLWAEKESRYAGVEQVFEPPISLGNTRRLKLDFRLIQQAQRDTFTSLNDFPLRLDVFCRTGHKNPRIYSWVFSVSAVKKKALKKRVVKVSFGQWFHFERSVGDLSTSICRVEKVRLTGGGLPEREVWVKQVGVVKQ